MVNSWGFLFISYVLDLALVKPVASICQWAQANRACFTSQRTRKEADQQTENFQTVTASLQPKTTEDSVTLPPLALAEWGAQNSSLISLTKHPNPLLG